MSPRKLTVVEPEEEEAEPEEEEEEDEPEAEEEEAEPAEESASERAEDSDTPVDAPAPRARRPKKPKPPRMIGAPPKKKKWAASEGPLIWDEMCEAFGKRADIPVDAYGVEIRVARENVTLGTIAGQSVTGTQGIGGSGSLPGTVLRETVIERFHKAIGGSPGRYTIFFIRKDTRQIFGQGTLDLLSVEQINAIQQAEYAAKQRAANESAAAAAAGFGPPVGFGAGHPAPQGYSQAPPVYYPPPSAGSSTNPEVSQLRAEVGRLGGILEQVLLGIRDGRPLPTAPPPPPAPPSDPLPQLMETITFLKTLGWGPPGVGAPAAAPPAAVAQVIGPQTPVEAAASARANVDAYSVMADSFGRMVSVTKRMQNMFGGGQSSGGPDDDALDSMAEAEEQAEDPYKYRTTAGMKVAVDKKTNKMSLMGTAIANPDMIKAGILAAAPVGMAIAQRFRIPIPGVPMPPPPAPPQGPAPRAAVPTVPAENAGTPGARPPPSGMPRM